MNRTTAREIAVQILFGDRFSDVNLDELMDFHKSHGRIATLTTVNIGQAKGILDIGSDNRIRSFREKDDTDGTLVNGGFMVMEPEIFSYISGDDSIFEKDVLPNLAQDGELMSYYHEGFWQCMDTQREKKQLEDLWESGNAPWKTW